MTLAGKKHETVMLIEVLHREVLGVCNDSDRGDLPRGDKRAAQRIEK